jgi:hypothetical protein
MITIAIILMVLYFIEQVVVPYGIALGYRMQDDLRRGKYGKRGSY